MKLVIPLKPESWNVLVRKHYRVVQAFKDKWEQAVFYEVRRTRMPPVRNYPVTLKIEAHWKQKRLHDIDALCAKYAVDSLVRAGVLAEDNLKHVSQVTFTGKIGQPEDELVIEITENTP